MSNAVTYNHCVGHFSVFVPLPIYSAMAGGMMFSTCPFVRYQTREKNLIDFAANWTKCSTRQ